MHELSIALSIVEGVEEEVERQGGGRVSAVHLRLGPLAGVVPDALLFSFDLACEGTALAGSRLVIEEVPVRIHCPQCALDSEPVTAHLLQCPACGHPACQVLQGAELEMAAMELIT